MSLLGKILNQSKAWIGAARPSQPLSAGATIRASLVSAASYVSKTANEIYEYLVSLIKRASDGAKRLFKRIIEDIYSAAHKLGVASRNLYSWIMGKLSWFNKKPKAEQKIIAEKINIGENVIPMFSNVSDEEARMLDRHVSPNQIEKHLTEDEAKAERLKFFNNIATERMVETRQVVEATAMNLEPLVK